MAKQTRSEMFSLIYHFASDVDGEKGLRENKSAVEAIKAFALAEAEKLEAKSAKAKAARKKNDVERDEIAKIICTEFLSENEDNALTATEISRALGDVSVQKVTYILTKLVDENIVTRLECKGKVKKFMLS